MGLESLLGKIEEAAARIKVLEREKSEAAARIQALEKEGAELRSLISLAESKADEMLKVATAPGAPRHLAAQPPQLPVASRGLEDLVQPSPAEQEELKRRFPHAFSTG